MRVRVLLTDGRGVTSRQMALPLAESGHQVGVATPPGRPPLPRPRTVAVHPVPPVADRPWEWLDAFTDLLRGWRYDAVLPCGAATAVLSRAPDRVLSLGTGLAVPPYPALTRVQERSAFAATLTEIALPQPDGVVVSSAEALRQVDDPPLWVKVPVGPGVYHITRREDLLRLTAALDVAGLWHSGGRVLVQHPVAGPVLLAQAVFERGRLVALDTALRSSRRPHGALRPAPSDVAAEHVAMLGGHLGWHGALSLEAVDCPDTGLRWIGARPYLTEPAHAHAAGANLTGALLEVCSGASPAFRPTPTAPAGTHAFAPALVHAAGSGRRRVLGELTRAVTRRGDYRRSRDRLLSVRAEPRAAGRLGMLALGAALAPAGTRSRWTRACADDAVGAAGWAAVTSGAPPRAAAGPDTPPPPRPGTPPPAVPPRPARPPAPAVPPPG